MNERNLISISYAKQVLRPDSREHERMRMYADLVDNYHVIVFTRAEEKIPAEQHVGDLHLYATNARTKIGMLFRAFLIGRSILRKSSGRQFVVTSQDPFESSLVGRVLTLAKNARHHVQIHGDLFNAASYKSSILQRFRYLYGCYVIKRTPSIRVVSKRIKSSVVQLGVQPDRVLVLPIQADLKSFFQIGRNRVYHENISLKLLALGRLAPEKNIAFLLQAARLLHIAKFPFTLEIVGSGPEEQLLKSMVVDFDLTKQVTFTAWTDDVLSIMKRSDVFCVTSEHEGWGMVLIEAAAAGLAIVSTDVGCVGEALVDRDSVLVAETPKQFVEAINILQDSAARVQFAKKAHKAAHDFVNSNDNYVQRVIDGYFIETR